MASMASTLISLSGKQNALSYKAMPFLFMDSNKLKGCKTGVTNHTWPILHQIRPQVITTLVGGYTDAYTYTNTQIKLISRNRACGRQRPLVPGLTN